MRSLGSFTKKRGDAAGTQSLGPRVLFFIPNLTVGGAELHTVDLVQRLRERGLDCGILVHGSLRSETITTMPGAHDAVFLGLRGLSAPLGWVKVWKALRRLKPDVIVAVNQPPLLVALIERMFFATRARIACVFHTTELRYYEAYQQLPLRVLSPLTDLMVYVGMNQRRVWESRGLKPRSVRTIYNGIDASRFGVGSEAGRAVRSRFGVSGGTLLLGIVAALRSEKNHVELVRALAQVRERGIDSRVLVVGDGETREEISALAHALNVDEHVIFAGEQQDVAPFIAACDVGILSSVSETFPLSALEFLASGVPMISARVGGAHEIVQHGHNGLLYESGNAAALADAISACADVQFRNGLASRARASVARFTAEAMTDAYVSALESLVAR